MNDVTTPIVEAKDVADVHRYGEDEYPLIANLVLGAQALLHNAGAFKPNNHMTKTAVIMIVGHWLENRDAMNYDFKHANNLPFSLKALVHSLQYAPDDIEGDAIG